MMAKLINPGILRTSNVTQGMSVNLNCVEVKGDNRKCLGCSL